jgi:pimeloyl-ACP methyl ester carboxylesterase
MATRMAREDTALLAQGPRRVPRSLLSAAMTTDIIGPTSSYFVSQRLRLHYVDWGNPDAPLLLLVHGGKDHARNWDWVARELRHEFHIVAPDLRGHGDSAWAIGGPYSMMDHVLDLTQLLEMLGEFPVAIVAHSLGGALSLMYAGLYPENVRKLVAIEGLGPPPQIAEKIRDRPVWQRAREWIESTRGLAARQPRRYDSIGAAAARMQKENSFLSGEQAEHLTRHAVARNEDGSYSWKFDNYTRPFYPLRPTEEETRALWGRIECPILHVLGSESWAGDPAADGRNEAFKNARSVTVDGAEHWVHHDRLDEFVRVVRGFLDES